MVVGDLTTAVFALPVVIVVLDSLIVHDRGRTAFWDDAAPALAFAGTSASACERISECASRPCSALFTTRVVAIESLVASRNV